MGRYHWTAAEDVPVAADAELVELERSNKCMRKGQAVRVSHWIAAEDARPFADAKCGELQCNCKCM